MKKVMVRVIYRLLDYYFTWALIRRRQYEVLSLLITYLDNETVLIIMACCSLLSHVNY